MMAAEAEALNQDLMVAKVPHWFMRLSGWEGRLVALKADIALIFGVKPETKDGEACMKAIEQVIYDFLAHITSRPDRKINKGLTTAVEAELEQAKLTISSLKDTQMRQETILRQYAEESKYQKDAVSRRDADLGMQRSQFLKEILRLKSEITRLESASSHTGEEAARGGGPGGGMSVSVLSDGEKSTVIRLQSELKDVKREAERLMDQLNDLNLENEALSQQIQEMQVTHSDEMQQIISNANNRISELEHTLELVESQKKNEPTCWRCSEAIDEPICAKCYAAAMPQAPESAPELAPELVPESPQTPHTQATPSSPATPAPATPAPAPAPAPAKSLKGLFTSKARMVGTLSAIKPFSGPGDGSMMLAPLSAAPPPASTRVPSKKKTWSFERDVQAWREHCEKKMAEEREDFKVKLQYKEGEIEEIMQAALQGRLEVIEQVTILERNFWETKIIEMKKQQMDLSKAYCRLCEDVADDLEDLALFVQHRKIPWVTAKEGQSKTNEEFSAFIKKQLAIIRDLRKEHRQSNQRKEREHSLLEADRAAVANERRRSELELFDLRKKLVDSNTKIGRLEFQISQLEGSQFPGHTREQAKRLQTIKSLDDDHGRGLQGGIETLKASTSTDRYAVEKVNRCRNELSKTIHPLPPDFASDFAIKIDGTVRHLRQVFDANLLEEDGEDDIAPGSGSPVCTVASSPVAERASGLSQLDPMKLRMENTQLKKQLRRFRDKAMNHQDLSRMHLFSEKSPSSSRMTSQRESPSISRTGSSSSLINTPSHGNTPQSTSLLKRAQTQAGRVRSDSPDATSRRNQSSSPDAISRTKSSEGQWESNDETDHLEVGQRILRSSESRKLSMIPDSPLLIQSRELRPENSPVISPRTKAQEGERSILRSYAGDQYLDDDNSNIDIIWSGSNHRATQTPVAWQCGGKGHSTGRGVVKVGGGEELSRDALMASMLPSMNLMVVPMKSSKGALNAQPQLAAAWQLPEQTLRDIHQRNALSLFERHEPPLQRPQSARTSPLRPSSDAQTGSESSREPLQGRGFSRRISESYSIEIVKEPKPPPQELTVEGVQSVKRHRSASGPFARRLMSVDNVEATYRELKLKEIKLSLLAAQNAEGAADAPVSPAAFPVRGAGFAKEQPPVLSAGLSAGEPEELS